eukprot:gene2202-2241_t
MLKPLQITAQTGCRFKAAILSRILSPVSRQAKPLSTWQYKKKLTRYWFIMVAKLLAHDINLIAYHLPLDAHPTLGNNARLAQILGFDTSHTTGRNGLIGVGRSQSIRNLGQLTARIADKLGRVPLVIGDSKKKITRIAWCTGAAQSMFQEAIDAGADVFITGEISEPTVHLARESGVAFISAGHHATERYGVQALGQALLEHFPITVKFMDVDNPV